MTAAAAAPTSLLDRLPPVRGRLTAAAPLDRLTWFRVGGPAEVLFRPQDADDLRMFLQECPADVPLTVLGVGSNLLVRDGGVPGVVIRLGGPFAAITVGEDHLSVGAGALDLNVATAAREAGLAGLEFLGGIPGTLGGALRMNAGAHGREMKDIVAHVAALTRDGQPVTLSATEMGFGYRHCGVDTTMIFTGATLRATPDTPEAIRARMDGYRARREDTQPLGTATGGSTFANPEGHRAWELIDAAGCRGLRRGGAMVSEKHCNFLINTGDATAADLEGLGEEVRKRVAAHSGIRLRWEIRRIGVAAPQPEPREASQ